MHELLMRSTVTRKKESPFAATIPCRTQALVLSLVRACTLALVGRQTRCQNGMAKTTPGSMHMHVSERSSQAHLITQVDHGDQAVSVHVRKCGQAVYWKQLAKRL